MRRRLHHIDDALRQVSRRHILDRRATIAGHMHQPVIGADPEQSLGDQRLFDVEDVLVALRRDLLVGDGVTALALLFGLVPRQIAARTSQLFPRLVDFIRYCDP